MRALFGSTILMATLAGSFAAQPGLIVKATSAGANGGLDEARGALPYVDAATLIAGDSDLSVAPATPVAPTTPGIRARFTANLATPPADAIPGQPLIAGGLPSLGGILADLHRQRLTVLRL